jgi:hypothetical protein
LFPIAGIIEQAGSDGAFVLPPPLPSQAEPKHEDYESARQQRELGGRLRALRSYFKTSNHPLSEAERAQVLERDFVNEARVARACLLKYAELLSGLTAQQSSADESVTVDDVSFDDGVQDACEVVNELTALCGALAGGACVSFQAWTSFGNIARRQLEAVQDGVTSRALAAAGHGAPLPTGLSALAARVSPESLSADLGAIFSRMFGLLDLLGHVSDALRADEPVKLTLPIFTLIREDAFALLDFLGERAVQAEALDPSAREHLDGTAYAVRMELRKAFEHELVGVVAMRHAPQIYARAENAHGLLRDCFQQSVIGVARAFEQGFEGTEIFSNFRTKLEQSLQLRGDLWEVLEAVRGAEREGLRRTSETLKLRLAAFREGSLCHLMYKDWEAYERFADEVMSAKSAAELQPLLHRFSAFLETLFSQVCMRAVLAEHPFAPPAPRP